MPRDSNGNYQLPETPAVDGTVATADWINSQLGDLESAVQGSLSRHGQGGMTTPLDMNYQRIVELGAPLVSTDAATLGTVTAHNDVNNAHSATAAATANRIVLRDANGRAQFTDPGADQDAATKAYVDAAGTGALAVARINANGTIAAQRGQVTVTCDKEVGSGSYSIGVPGLTPNAMVSAYAYGGAQSSVYISLIDNADSNEVSLLTLNNAGGPTDMGFLFVIYAL